MFSTTLSSQRLLCECILLRFSEISTTDHLNHFCGRGALPVTCADVTMANMASACALVMSSNDTAKLFGPLRYWRTRQAASTCILVTISAICVCILVVCGVLLAREYSLAKGYKRTSCVVSNVTYSSDISCHFCSGHKDKSRDKGSTGACVVSSFPCLRIYVMYNIGSTSYEALLHPDSIQAAGLYREVG